MSAVQLALFAAEDAVAEAWRAYLDAARRHRALACDKACLVDGEHWQATKVAQREVVVAHERWLRAREAGR